MDLLVGYINCFSFDIIVPHGTIRLDPREKELQIYNKKLSIGGPTINSIIPQASDVYTSSFYILHSQFIDVKDNIKTLLKFINGVEKYNQYIDLKQDDVPEFTCKPGYIFLLFGIGQYYKIIIQNI